MIGDALLFPSSIFTLFETPKAYRSRTPCLSSINSFWEKWEELRERSWVEIWTRTSTPSMKLFRYIQTLFVYICIYMCRFLMWVWFVWNGIRFWIKLQLLLLRKLAGRRWYRWVTKFRNKLPLVLLQLPLSCFSLSIVI